MRKLRNNTSSKVAIIREDVDEETRRKQDAIVPMYNTRLGYFVYRIKYLQLEVEQAEEARIKAIADRSRLSHEMTLSQSR